MENNKHFYNLLIIDASGSMDSIRKATVGGINETIGTIRCVGRETGARQNLTMVTFCGCGVKTLVRNIDAAIMRPMTLADYIPCCMTPLYDAIGRACTDLKKQIGGDPEAVVSVTVITDGAENASSEWTHAAVKALIESLKAEGWMFAFIGANIDAAATSSDLGIDNALQFDASEDGTREMFEQEKKARKRWAKKRMEVEPGCAPCDVEAVNKCYFDEE